MLIAALLEKDQASRLVSIRDVDKAFRRAHKFFCWECLGPLVARLGPQKAHHFAHRPDAVCAAARGEGQEHQNAKAALFLELTALAQEQGVLFCKIICSRCSWQNIPIEVVRLQATDTVFTERSVGVGRRIADVLVKRDDRTLVAFEIYSRHLVPDEKWEQLKAGGLLCFESNAQQIQSSGYSWTRKDIFPYRKGCNIPKPIAAVCEKCVLEFQWIREQAEKQAHKREQARIQAEQARIQAEEAWIQAEEAWLRGRLQERLYHVFLIFGYVGKEVEVHRIQDLQKLELLLWKAAVKPWEDEVQARKQAEQQAYEQEQARKWAYREEQVRKQAEEWAKEESKFLAEIGEDNLRDLHPNEWIRSRQ